MSRPTSTESVFRAVAHVTRRRILELLAKRDWPATELASEFRHAQPTISRHLSVLAACGMVTTRRQGPRLIYQIVPGSLAELRRWLGKFPGAVQR